MPPRTARRRVNEGSARSRRPDDDEGPGTRRTASRRRAAPRKTSGIQVIRIIGIGIVVVLTLVGFAFKAANGGWRVVEQDSTGIAADQAFALDTTLDSPTRIQVHYQETGGHPMLVYWVTGRDYDAMQRDDAAATQRAVSQMLMTGSGGTKEITLGPGRFCICFEAEEDIPTRIEYTIKQQ